MLRGLLYLFLAIILITLLRGVIGLIGKAVAQLFQPESPSRRTRPAGTPAGGELVQDPVCGIYVSTETKLRKTISGKTHHFCSEACMNKFHG